LILTGFFTGLALGTKYTGIVLLLLYGIPILARACLERRKMALAAFILIGVTTPALWYLRNIYYTGNPVFPFCRDFFTSQVLITEEYRNYKQKTPTQRSPLRALVTLPWDLTTYGTRYKMEAPLSPWYGYLLPLVVFFPPHKRQLNMLLGLSLVYLVIWFYYFPHGRYLAPMIPLYSLASGLSLARFRHWLGSWPLLHLRPALIGVGCALLLVPGFAYAWTCQRKHGPLPITLEQRQQYLEKQLTGYQAFAHLNRTWGSEHTTYLFHHPEMNYFSDGNVLGNQFGPTSYLQFMRAMTSGVGFYRKLSEHGAGFLLVTEYPFVLQLPADAFFYRRFKLIDLAPYARLYQLVREPCRYRVDRQEVLNGNCEQTCLGLPKHWDRPLNERMKVATGERDGAAAVFACSSRKDSFAQCVEARANRIYLFRLLARSVLKGARVRIQVGWYDCRDRLLHQEYEVRATTRQWNTIDAFVRSPPGACKARITASAHDERRLVYFDQFSLTGISWNERVGSRSGTTDDPAAARP